MQLLQALDPRHFVDIRRVIGGPAPEAVASALEQAEAEQRTAGPWIAEKRVLLNGYRGKMREQRPLAL